MVAMRQWPSLTEAHIETSLIWTTFQMRRKNWNTGILERKFLAGVQELPEDKTKK